MRVSLSIRLCKATNIHNLLPTTACSSSDEGEHVVEAWLSYRMEGAVIQSPKFELYHTRTQNFESIEDVFDLAAGNSIVKLISSLSSLSFDVYICTHGSLLGKANVNIQRLLALNDEGDEAFAERSGKGTFYFTTKDAVDGCKQDESVAAASIEISMSLKRESSDDTGSVVSRTCKFESCTRTTSCQTSPFKSIIPQHLQVNESPAPTSSATESEPPPVGLPTPAAPVPTQDERVQFEKERRRWEEWRHKEEIKWHNKMREQETAALKALDEQSKAQERQNSKEIDAKKKEFENLEGRLRKALAEVEKRERRIRTVEASREAEYTTKRAEIELKQKFLKEESKHAAEIENAKLKAANERVAMAEKATALEEERVRAIESNFEAFKKAHRESHEGSLQQEISTLKGELVAAKSRINRAIQEKNEANFEKEQHRANLHKLAKALKKEKLKVQAMEEKERQQFHLEKKRHCLEMSNNREELNRITSQLQGLDTNAGPTGSDDGASAGKDSMPPQKLRVTGPLPAPLTPPRHPLSKSTAVSTSEADSLRHPVGLRKTNLDARAIQMTPATKVWNGTAFDTTRHVASDSKLQLSRC